MKQRTTGALVLTALAGGLAFVFLGFRSAGIEFAYPIENARSHVVRRICSRITGAWRGARAEAENVRLKREVALLALLKADCEQLESENERLRMALGYLKQLPGDWVAASVLSRGGGAAGTRKTLRVDRGGLSGIERGAVAVVPEGLVGRVVAVTPHTAEVLLVTDSLLRFSCELETSGTARPRGILAGGDEMQLALTHIRPDPAAAPPRTRVVTSGLTGAFPRGLVIGTYLGNGAVEPSVDYSALEDVFIRRDK